MKKIKKDLTKFSVNHIILITLFSILFLSIGFSAFNNTLLLDDIAAYVKASINVRVESITFSTSSSGSYSSNEDHNVTSVNGSVHIPNADDYVEYKIKIANLGNVEAGILKATNNNSKLDFVITDYEYGDKICEEIDGIGLSCKNGVEQTITLRVKWKDYDSANADQNFNFEFDFQYYNKITLEENASNYVSECPDEILNNGNFRFRLDNSMLQHLNIYIGGIKFTNYRYEDGYIYIDNVYGDVSISVGFNITLDWNDGSGRTEIIHIEPNKNMKQIDVIPENTTSLKFLGWYNKADYNNDATLYYDNLGIPCFPKYNLSDDLTLYAGWAQQTYIIQYHSDLLDSDGLPNEYERVNYITSDGSEYIKTGIIPNPDMKIEIELSVEELVTSFFFGSRNGYKINAYEGLLTTLSATPKFRFDHGANDGPTVYEVEVNKKYKITYDKNNVYINGVYQSSSSPVYDDFTSSLELYLFALNEYGKAKQFSEIDVYSVKIWDNNNLVREYVPSSRKSDGEIGLYDKVSGQFFTNSGNGSFTKDIKEYKELIAVDEERKLNSNIVSKKGYTLTGWKDDFGNTYTKDQVVKNLPTNSNGIIDLYPIYQIDKLVVSFSSGTNDKLNDIYVTFNDRLSSISGKSGAIPTKEGYVFTGWYDNENYANATMYYDESANLVYNDLLTNNLELYAGWAKIESGVKTNGNQLIQTGYIPNQDTKVETEIKLLSNKVQFIYGARNSTVDSMYSLGYVSNKYRFDYDKTMGTTIAASGEYDKIYQ